MTTKKLRNAVTILMYLSKVNGKLYLALDGNNIDLEDFGITSEQFNQLGFEVDRIMQQILNPIPESIF